MRVRSAQIGFYDHAIHYDEDVHSLLPKTWLCYSFFMYILYILRYWINKQTTKTFKIAKTFIIAETFRIDKRCKIERQVKLVRISNI